MWPGRVRDSKFKFVLRSISSGAGFPSLYCASACFLPFRKDHRAHTFSRSPSQGARLAAPAQPRIRAAGGATRRPRVERHQSHLRQDALRTCAIDGENEGQRRALLTARGGGDSHSPSGANASAPRALRPPRNTPVQRYGVVRHQRNSFWTPRRVQHGAEGAEEMPACGVQRVVESLVAGLRSSDGPSTRSSIVMRPCVRVKRRRARRAV